MKADNPKKWQHGGYMPSCTQFVPLSMLIPPGGITIECPVHKDGHFVTGPPQTFC
jgi:hypothetical protein